MNSKIIFITGCSSGIGFHAVFALKQRGHRVIASCRKQKDVQRLTEMGIETIQLDVNCCTSIKSGFEQLCALTSSKLDVLINNAGYGQAGALEDISREVLRAQFETNVFGLLELTNYIIPIMRQQGSGRIINISSVLGVVSLPFIGAYNASKYAVEGLSDTLRLELHSSNIKVITIEPGPIETQFGNNSIEGVLQGIDMEKSYFKEKYATILSSYKQTQGKSSLTQKPKVVVDKLIHAVEAKKPKAKYPVTPVAHIFILLKRILTVKTLDKFLLLLSRKDKIS